MFWAENSNGLKQGRFNVCAFGHTFKRSETGPLQFACFGQETQTVANRAASVLVLLTENPNGLLDPRCDLRYRLKVEFDVS